MQAAPFEAGPAAPAAAPAPAAGKDPERIVGDTMEFIFSEYDGDKDGLLTRKEFFTVRTRTWACRA